MPTSLSGEELAKRQVALLGKMLLYSIDHLTEEEQRIYDSLIEELAPRADGRGVPMQPQARAAAPSMPAGAPKPAPSFPAAPRPGGAPGGGAPHLIPGSSPTPQGPRLSQNEIRQLPQNRKLQGAKPEVVVRMFIECWNKQDFKQEYFCLSEMFSQGQKGRQSLEEYVNGRYERFANRHMTGPINKQVVDISAAVLDGDMAAVQVAERHTGKNEDMILYRTYKLHFEDTAWRITNFVTNQTRVRKRV
jgi:hypothetical protein